MINITEKLPSLTYSQPNSRFKSSLQTDIDIASTEFLKIKKK